MSYIKESLVKMVVAALPITTSDVIVDKIDKFFDSHMKMTSDQFVEMIRKKDDAIFTLEEKVSELTAQLGIAQNTIDELNSKLRLTLQALGYYADGGDTKPAKEAIELVSSSDEKDESSGKQ